MKSYLSLIPLSARRHKKENKMTRFCIIIAVFLVTSIFSMADMGIRMETNRLIDKHGNWHIFLKNTDTETAEEIGQRSDVAAASWYDAINYGIDGEYYIGGKKAVICGAEEPFFSDMFTYFEKDTYPYGDSEIVLTESAQDLLGFNKGDAVTLRTPAGDLEYTISGFCSNTVLTLQMDVVGAFVNMDAFQEICAMNGGKQSQPVYYIQFDENRNMRKAIAEIKEQYGLTADQLSENTAVLGVSGFSSDSYMMGLYAVAAVLFFLVLLAGILMIAGSINSNIAQRTQFFGMLRCIGASRRQIIRFVRLEALNWCKTAIPLGLAFGIAITWGICAVLKFFIGGEFSTIPVLEVSAIGIVSGIIVGFLTVLLAAQAPAKRAARVSPMAAVSDVKNTKKIRHGAHTRFAKIETALGIHHAVSAKRNLLLMTGSFALSIILFLSFSTLLTFLQHALTALSPSAPDISIASQDRSNSVDASLIDEINKVTGVERAFGRMFCGGIPAEYAGKNGKLDLISYEEYQLEWAKAEVIDGDISKLLEDSSYVLANFDDQVFKAGDKIRLDNAELEVAAVLASVPFDSDETPLIICSEETFTRLTGETDYAVIDIQLNSGATDETANALRDLSAGHTFSDRRESNREVTATYWAFRILVYGFLAIIAMITVFNIMNSISMSVSARIKQYGIMRAVGMEGRQMIKMIAAEAVTYAIFGCIAGVLIGLPLHRFLFDQMITQYWGTVWQVPLGAIAVILLLVAATSAAAVYKPAKSMVNMAVTDTINAL